ncbi:VanZ family protein [Brevibacillus brevis]|nr:VanZ family protein [Brevibacillus brevis]
MMETKSRQIILVGTICYTILILFFMFFAFNRLDGATSVDGYTFILAPEGVPLTFPELTYSWIVDFGNVAAFIPFGILFPLLYRVRFGKFISLFVLAIFVLETVQALTYLGSFDVNDVISNTIGAAIGYVAYRVGFSSNLSYKKLMASALTIVVLVFGVMVVSEILQKREGPVQSLTVMKEMTGTTPITENFPSFSVAGERIEPKMNVYSSEGESTKTYNYILGNQKNVWLSFYFGIPDNGGSKGEAKIIVDGQELAQLNEQSYQGAEALREMPFNEVNEITIIVSGNAKLWDVGIRGMQHWWE